MEIVFWDKLLSPYQKIINKLNAEFNWKVYIPEENKAEVYSNFKKNYRSIEEFESELKRQLQKVLR